MRGTGRTAVAAVAALCAVAGLPAQARAAESPYTYDNAAQRVKGAATTTDSAQLKPGSVYRDTIKKDGKVYYRVDLDGEHNAYVSVVVVPPPGGKAEYGDGVKVSLQDGSGSQCSYEDAQFGSAGYTRPITAYVERAIDPDGGSSCQSPGAYYVLVERTSKSTSTPQDWGLEIRHLTEPRLKAAGPTKAPESWPSASPQPPAGGPKKRAGGTSYYDAPALREGEWRDDIKPGQTLFYRVPVDWGQQIFATAELGSATAGDEYVGNALVLSLDNPARGHVSEQTLGYSGKQATLALEPQPPVTYENRFDSDTSTSAMRFAGWYYLSATLSPEVVAEYGDKPVPLTLRVNVTGQANEGPGYDGDAGPFAVTDDDQDAAASGQSGSDADATSGTMKLVAAAGIGVGVVLLLGLGGWTLVARRRASRTPAEPAQYGPPNSW
ncbi:MULTISPECIES: hypothetical protein [Streptomyces]|uniref:Uncharacterized protein n=1 Tax=Streptomyces solicathayae TaxID=3081768 RepID=A0ABZ0M4L6_9ACTN|nr:hypothetical protein [Streptomyces sp. HUAS YS2]WOX26682.1 hypothetical protein R2D22_18320 [Streptomyces sp. HUAS YS2]